MILRGSFFSFLKKFFKKNVDKKLRKRKKILKSGINSILIFLCIITYIRCSLLIYYMTFLFFWVKNAKKKYNSTKYFTRNNIKTDIEIDPFKFNASERMLSKIKVQK